MVQKLMESVLTMLSLDQQKTQYDIFAPNEKIPNNINYLIKENNNDSRNILQEFAKIARGNISDIKNLNEKNYDGLILPDGFGAVKNLCNIVGRYYR